MLNVSERLCTFSSKDIIMRVGVDERIVLTLHFCCKPVRPFTSDTMKNLVSHVTLAIVPLRKLVACFRLACTVGPMPLYGSRPWLGHSSTCDTRIKQDRLATSTSQMHAMSHDNVCDVMRRFRQRCCRDCVSSQISFRHPVASLAFASGRTPLYHNVYKCICIICK